MGGIGMDGVVVMGVGWVKMEEKGTKGMKELLDVM